MPINALMILRALESCSELLIATVGQARFLHVNLGGQQLLGWSEAELQGMRWLDLVHPESHAYVIASYERTRSGEPPQKRVPIRVRDARGRWLILTVYTVALKDDEILLIARDVTEEHALRERTAELELSLGQINEVARVGGWRLDMETHEVWWSDITCEICEASASDVTLAEALAFYPDEVRETLAETLERSFATMTEWEMELPFRTLKGTRRRVFARGRPMQDAEGRVQMIGTFQDVTERYEMEQRLRRFERTQSLGMLAGGVAHDINNLTGVILGNTALLLHDDPRPEQAEPLEDIQAATQHIRHISQQLLGFTGARSATLTRFELLPLLQETARELRPLLATQVELSIEVTPPELVARADRTQLRQMLENLILNAAHADATHISLRACVYQGDLSAATPAQTPIGVPEADRPWLMIEADDNGRGMTPEVLQRAFDPFFTTRSSGHGLGLSTVLGTLQAHHGRLIVTSTPGEGARFVLCLPPAP